jgi:hypothetical protein
MFRFPSEFTLAVLMGAAIFTGCGATKSRVATEQLLVSDAVDDAVSSIDFRGMAGRKVFFDSKYIRTVKSAGFVNADYIISSLRQQMIAADCRLVENHGDAEIIVEARVGTLGSDGSEVSFGIPASNVLSTAATLVPSAPAIPAIPEVSFARKEGQVGAAKIAVFAYERDSGRPIWQSGIARARSTSQDFWLFGAGPFQNGTIHKGTRFAGEQLRLPMRGPNDVRHMRSAIAYNSPYDFPDPAAKNEAVIQASHSREEPGVTGDNETAQPIQLWGSGGNVATPLEVDLERRLGDTE